MPRTLPAPSPRRRTWRWAIQAVGWLGVAAAVVWVYPRVDPERLMPIEFIRVEGELLNLDPEEFRRALLPRTEGGFLLADLDAIKTAVESDPWIERARTGRLWPNTLVVTIREQRPVARWGIDSLLNERGERFQPRNVAPFGDLPLLTGPAGQEKTVLATFRAMNAKLESRGVRVDSLQLSNRRAWVAELSGGVEVVFGHQDPLPALDRLLALLPQLGEERWPAIRKLDLRYPNGFAVVWRSESPSIEVPLRDPNHTSMPVPRQTLAQSDYLYL